MPVPPWNEPWYSHILHVHSIKATFCLETEDHVLGKENGSNLQVSSLWICLRDVIMLPTIVVVLFLPLSSHPKMFALSDSIHVLSLGL